MQTFLPYKSFNRTAHVLDRQRLGKQRVETLQIMKALLTGQGWVNHPATLMWKGCELVLLQYQIEVCYEWVNVRGYKDTCLDKTYDLVGDWNAGSDYPAWLGNRAFHLSHRSNLVRKDPDHYGKFFPGVPDDLEYVWPARK